MQHTRTLLGSVLGLVLLLTGCSDDFLTTVPPDQLSDAVFWKTEQDVTLAVNAIYPSVWGDNIIHLEAVSDNAFQHKQWERAYEYATGTHDASTQWGTDIWNNAYTGIRRANTVLANIDNVAGIDPTRKERLKGEATFLRAYHYTHLVNLFGGVPLILEPITIAEGREITRTGASAVVDQILADLDYAAGVLPTTYNDADAGRATRGAALALKARAALYAGRYQEAATAARAVMDLGVYDLYPNYRDLFTYAGEGSDEIIFARQQLKNQYATGVFGAFANYSNDGGSNVVPARALVDAYLCADGLPVDDPNSTCDPADPYVNRDPRMDGSLLYPGAEWDGGVYNSMPDSPTADRVGSDFNATSTGYNLKKYIDLTDKNDRGNGGIDYILIRYADVLLMYAEAKIELGQIDQSVYDALNAVRARVDMPAVTAGKSQAELRDIVRLERRVELALEGLRLFDLRRWQTAETTMNGRVYGLDYVENGELKTISPDARRFVAPRDYLWPIPQRERDLNPNLEQNQGY